MLKDQALRQKLHHQIEQLTEAQLIELESWFQQKQARKRERILSHAGSWSELPDDIQQALEDDLTHRRHSNPSG